MPRPRIGHQRCSFPPYFCGMPECEGGWHQHCVICGKRRESEEHAEEKFLKRIAPPTL